MITSASFRLGVAIVLLVGGIIGAGYTHWLLQNQLIAQRDEASIHASEAYSNTIKSELEISRLGPAIAAMKLSPSPENASALSNALDTAYSRHNLMLRASSMDEVRAEPGFKEVSDNIRSALDRLDDSIGASSLNLDAAWQAQAELAVLFNEVARMALEHRADVEFNRLRDLERFARNCATFNVLSLSSLVTGFLMVASLWARRLRTEETEDGYELV